MKLRSRKADTDEASTPAPKLAKLNTFESIHPGMLVSYGNHGQCVGSECDGVPIEAAKIRGRNLCEICATKEYGSELKEIFKIDTLEDLWIWMVYSDATFKCPAYDNEGSCKSEKVDIKQFYLGSCCEPASKTLFENIKAQERQLKVVHDFVKHEDDFLRTSKNDCERAKILAKMKEDDINREEEALEKMKKSVEKSEESLEKKKKELVELKNDHEEEKKFVIRREKEKKAVLKRFKHLTYEYHSVATKLPLDDEVEARENRKDYQYCRLCGKDYNDTDRRKSVLVLCGHVACLKCFKGEFNEDVDYPYCPMNWTKECSKEYYLHHIITLYE